MARVARARALQREGADATEGCGGCSGVSITYTPACKARFARLWAQESDEKAFIQPKAPAVLGGPAVVPPGPLFEHTGTDYVFLLVDNLVTRR